MRTLRRRQKKRRGGKPPRSMFDEETGHLIEPLTMHELESELSDFICRNVKKDENAIRLVNSLLKDYANGLLPMDVERFVSSLMMRLNDYSSTSSEHWKQASHLPLHQVIRHLQKLPCLKNKMNSVDVDVLFNKAVSATKGTRRRQVVAFLQTDHSSTVRELAIKLSRYVASSDSLDHLMEAETSDVNVREVRRNLLHNFLS